jgi:lipopolysaccharide export system protein LptC
VRPFYFLMSLIALCLTVFSAVTVRFKNVNTNIKNSEYVAGKLRNLVFTNDKE